MKTTSPNPASENLKTVLKFVSLTGLLLTVVPAFLVFAGVLDWSTHAILMGVGAVLWFGSAPFWMSR
jgi:hypothetical protein